MITASTDPQPRPRAPSFAALVAAGVGCALLVAAVGALAPHLALAPLPAFALAFAAVSLELLVLAAVAPTATVVPVLLAGLGLVGALALLHDAPAQLAPSALLTFALGTSAALVGASLGGRIEQPGQLTAVALVSAIADLWSVLDPQAPSARLAADALAAPERLALFALPFPLLGTTVVPPLIGAGDLVFAALYVAAYRRHGLPVLRALSALALAFALGLAALIITLRPLPLLPLLGAAVVLADRRARSLDPRGWRTVLLVCAALLAAIALRVAR